MRVSVQLMYTTSNSIAHFTGNWKFFFRLQWYPIFAEGGRTTVSCQDIKEGMRLLIGCIFSNFFQTPPGQLS